ncbi:hypothetical protein CEUSTIGMA_g1353.t1 [Chlamydomonas eustigma]|uniref:Mitochondrial import inner membrane translocase subunit TIM22 n=1 Tax=Chlamydomonas eustigma TaxID=1157962 RepID=A0A250WSV8_9CHLO|nr:hypothetical protein CEUSTIGMA_g1353.t1 [Chlamydomonas eustigma]|eukprot:GAX73903.1 hypothetical protein CEUSTIGMA_g1353.t1 [Chlamydomonas eustigma]
MASTVSTSTTDVTNEAKTKAKYQPIALPTTEQMMMEDVMSNCFVKTAISGLMGGVAGLAFGLFSASLENAHGNLDGPLIGDAGKSTSQVLKEMALNMKNKSV